MDEPTQSQADRGPGKNKRAWTDDEDAKLVAALVDMANIGTYKAENGFKPGYLFHLEGALQRTLPDSGLKAKPHIESRIKTLKGQFNIVYDMLNSPSVSGFGWDDTKKCLTADSEVWNSYLQTRPKHSYWKNKSFPWYEEFCIIFGKDRATGSHAETAADVVSEMNDKEYREEAEFADHILEDDAYVNNSTTSRQEKNEAPSTRKGKKRSRSDDGLQVIKEAASIIGGEIAKASLEFSKAIGVEAATSDKRQQLNSEVMKIEVLGPLDRIKVISYIGRDDALIDIFFSLNEKDREVMAMDIVEKNISI